ncbi:MAG: sulfate ABC transporter substrate-binding protein [Archangiaceae bacterium]|nr:sulfate ABC transporter substrate-binding protein [Archangiaceae bacterium]
MKRLLFAALLAAAACNKADAPASSSAVTLLNVSFDPTRELYDEVNQAFVKEYAKKTGVTVTVNQSHGGSGKQARAVIDGLEADVVTLALAYDIDSIATKAKLLPADWASRQPHGSAPFASTVLFVVRKGNPKGIHDWEDLAKPGVQVITPNPKTSGGARWNYLAAWGWALKKYGNDEARARELLTRIFANVPVLDTGARGATTTFAERGIGDVLVSWESDALLVTTGAQKELFEVVVPSSTILAETPVAVLDKNVDKHGTRAVAEAYVQFLYSPTARDIAARHGFRSTSEAPQAERFAKVETFDVSAVGGWAQAQKTHFDEKGVFDQLYKVK